MTVHIKSPSIIKAAGHKIIQEFIGRVNSNSDEISIARMKSPSGWSEPAQTPEFDEYTLVLKGAMHIQTQGKEIVVQADQVFVAKKGQKVRYFTPGPEGAEYIAICLPAFHPDSVHRDL